MNDARTVTQLLQSWRSGDQEALNLLMPRIYDELRRLAAQAMQGERPDHTLQPTALVHEAYLRLVDTDAEFEDRAHFLATATRVMRRILIDHARAKSRLKRGGGAVRVPLTDSPDPSSPPLEDFIALDAALTRLAESSERRSRVVELHYIGGLTLEESAVVLGVSTATVHRELKFSRAWLYRELLPRGS